MSVGPCSRSASALPHRQPLADKRGGANPAEAAQASVGLADPGEQPRPAPSTERRRVFANVPRERVVHPCPFGAATGPGAGWNPRPTNAAVLGL